MATFHASKEARIAAAEAVLAGCQEIRAQELRLLDLLQTILLQREIEEELCKSIPFSMAITA